MSWRTIQGIVLIPMERGSREEKSKAEEEGGLGTAPEFWGLAARVEPNQVTKPQTSIEVPTVTGMKDATQATSGI
ncbi:hypothetical protein DB31_8743 [Hyalangium minutum]|uniref:Uncharacterized protein n=1 Tax=Hyalangium minutum TaxID=394096 RepID=A0A085WI77_9BACT|nr:hypothetical protein DB31_8656 [Hyalangium minutum]KFE67390.1 hypothetical protein DB31_8743 [Hyalangium minutum]